MFKKFNKLYLINKIIFILVINIFKFKLLIQLLLA
jgi:hypothetical protein